jgi:hypothetical protein
MAYRVSSLALNRCALATRGAMSLLDTRRLPAGETHHSPAVLND